MILTMKQFKIKPINFIAILSLIIITSCNKTKQHSKWLTGETWQVNTVTIDGQPFDLLPALSFDDCDIYDEICFGNLSIENKGAARFAWQIREKGKIFELSDQTQNKDESNEEAVSFSSSFSGVFNVSEVDKKNMALESQNCKRYPGKKVVIKLTKK
jgi:hypothetical protein